MLGSNDDRNKKDEMIEEKFSSFLAGLLLTKRKISNFEFFTFLDNFQNQYNTYVIDDDINILLDTSNGCISLIDDYDAIIIYKDKKMTVRKYLYSMTSKNVREFFQLSPDIDKIINLDLIIKRKILRRKII